MWSILLMLAGSEYFFRQADTPVSFSYDFTEGGNFQKHEFPSQVSELLSSCSLGVGSPPSGSMFQSWLLWMLISMPQSSAVADLFTLLYSRPLGFEANAKIIFFIPHLLCYTIQLFLVVPLSILH